MVTSVIQWLRCHRLDRYAAAFATADIDADVLCTLTEADLKSLGFTLGDRKRFLRALATLPPQPVGTATAEPAGSQVAPDASGINPGAERRQLSVLFCDLVGSTALAARLDPEDLHEVMQAYERCCLEVVQRFEGSVVHVFGDGVMARFGYPQGHEDDAERAVRAALDLVAEIGQLSVAPGIRLQARIGIATGVVVVGDRLGPSSERTLVGDAPNLAARLQSLAEVGQVIVDQLTRRLTGDVFDCEKLDQRAVKGFASPVATWRVKGVRSSDSRFSARNAGWLTDMIGRDPEFGMLLDRWRHAENADGQVVLVSGEPGIGKSRLVASLLEYLQDRPHALVRWQCSPLRTHTTLFPAIEWLARVAGFEPDDPPRTKLQKLECYVGRAEGASLLADLVAAAPGARAEPPGPAAEYRERTLRALLSRLQQPGDARPMCFVVEDAHWADSTTLDLLNLAAVELRTRPALMLITYRPEFSPPWTGRDGVTSLTLERLGREACARVAQLVAGRAELPGALLDRILDRSDGVPLFVEELTRSALEAGGSDEGSREAAPGCFLEGMTSGATMPSSLQASLSARLDRLSTVKGIVQIAATIGRDFAYDLLAEVAACPAQVLRHALEQLTLADIVRPLGSGTEAAFSFKHALIQDAAYGSMLRGTRRHLHGRIAGALERRFPERCASDPEVLAHHLTEAGEARRAIDYRLASARHALERSAALDAIAHIERGLDLVAALPPSEDRNRIERTLQNTRLFPAISAFGWSSPEVELIYGRLLDLTRESADRRELFFTLYGDFAIRIMRAQTREALDVANRMTEVVRSLSDPDLTHHALRCRVAVSFFRGCFGDMRRDLDQIAGLARADGDWTRLDAAGASPQAAADMFEGCLLWCTGFPDQAARVLRRAHAVAQASGRVNVMAFVLQFSCVLGLLIGDFAAVRRHSNELLKLSAEHELKSYPPSARVSGGIIMIEEGRQSEGHSMLVAGLTELEHMNAFLSRPHLLCWVARCRAELDGLDAGLQILNEAADRVEQSGEHLWTTAIHRTRGILLVKGDREAEAERALLASIAAARSQGARSLELQAVIDLSHLWQRCGRARDALALLRTVLAGFSEGWTTPDLVRAVRLSDVLERG